MNIAIGSDHAGFHLKEFLISELEKLGHTLIDCGAFSEESVDYPDFAKAVCGRVVEHEVEFGIVICSTGIGISIAANKIHGIRAALCQTEYSARMSRQHNNANVLAFGEAIVGSKLALSIAETFINEEFSHGERHQRRIDKISGLEQ